MIPNKKHNKAKKKKNAKKRAVISKRRCVIDAAIGETRAAVYEGKQLVELYTRRWSDEATPQIGDIYIGRITEISKELAAAFIDLGSDQSGFLSFTMASGAPRFQEGQYLRVKVTGQREAGKSVIVKFEERLEGETAPKRLSRQSLQEMIAARFKEPVEFEENAVNSLDEACETEIAIAGGGSISIEKTRAMWVIDIDRGTMKSGFDAGLAACDVIARQLRLRGIGGLIAIDFPNIRQRGQKEKLMMALEDAFEGDPHMIKMAGLSRFGIVEMSRQQGGQGLDHILNDRFGRPTAQTRALYAIRLLMKEAKQKAGAQLILEAPSGVYDWLERDPIGWKAAATEKIGARFTVKRAAQLSIVSDR